MNQYIVGHRGAMGYAPENTLKAFKIGCQNGADVVECDIHLSRDKELVVIHDNTLDRTTNGKGWVRNYTLSELKQLNIGDGEKIPSLLEIVSLIQKYKKKLIIEVKGESLDIAEETAKKIASFIVEQNICSYVIIHSFWHQVIQLIKQRIPDIQAAVIMMIGLKPQEVLSLIKNAKADGASIAYDYISEELVSLMRTNSLFLDAWVLDNKSTFTRMKEMGVNGLITNFPGKFIL